MEPENVATQCGRREELIVGLHRRPGFVRQQRRHVGQRLVQLRSHLLLACDERVLGLEEVVLHANDVAEMQLALGDFAELLERLDLQQREFSRTRIHKAKRRDVVTSRSAQWQARVEARERLAGDLRVVGESLVLQRIRDDQRLVFQDRPPAERGLATALASIQAHP